MNQWMLSLEEQQKAIIKIDNIKIPNDFIKKFGTNAAMIKEFEHDLLFYESMDAIFRREAKSNN